MAEKKKIKPTKLEWLGGVASISKETPILVKSEGVEKIISEKKDPQKISGKVAIRKESKGRAGKPVAIIYKFSDPEANHPESLKQLCSNLKNILACGGTVENGEIVLTLRDFTKLEAALEKLGISAKLT